MFWITGKKGMHAHDNCERGGEALKMSEFKILFTSAGRRVSLLRSFKNALNELGLEGRLITADVRKDAAAHLVSDFQELVPPVTSSEYVPVLQEICERHRISLVVPLIDP